MAIEVGRKAPDFKLLDDQGREVRLKDLAGKRVVVYFYPRDATPGCTQEACDFRDAASRFQEKDTVVVGVSRDSVDSHKKFKEKHDLPFALLSDPELKMLKDYGAWGKKTLYGKTSEGVLRSTVLIGADGKVQKVWPKVKVAGHVEKVLEALD